MCGCGITKSCDQANVTCNCDIMDGVTRKDFGAVIHKEDLPITKVTVRDVGDDKIARYNVGWLKCAPTQFGENISLGSEFTRCSGECLCHHI